MTTNSWKTLQFSKNFSSSADIIQALEEKKMRVDETAKLMFACRYFRTIELKNILRSYVLITPRNLGLRGNVYHAEFFHRAEKSSLGMYSAYQAALLRLHILKQQEKEQFNTAMDPLQYQDNCEAIFTLYSPHKKVLSLCGIKVAYNYLWEDTAKFIFKDS